jgi:hypothetical protein
LLGRCSTMWATSPVLFAFITFPVGSHIYALDVTPRVLLPS